jgi:hypothetical protein
MSESSTTSEGKGCALCGCTRASESGEARVGCGCPCHRRRAASDEIAAAIDEMLGDGTPRCEKCGDPAPVTWTLTRKDERETLPGHRPTTETRRLVRHACRKHANDVGEEIGPS